VDEQPTPEGPAATVLARHVAWSLAAALAAAPGMSAPPPSVRPLTLSIAVPTPIQEIVASFPKPSGEDYAELARGLHALDGDAITRAIAQALDDSESLDKALASVLSAPTMQSDWAVTGVALGLAARVLRYKYKQPLWADFLDGVRGAGSVAVGVWGGQWLQAAAGSLTLVAAFTAWSRDRHRPPRSPDQGDASSPLDFGVPGVLLGEASDVWAVSLQAAQVLADLATPQAAPAGTGSVVPFAPSPPGPRPATDRQRVADFCALLDAWQAQLDASKPSGRPGASLA
jgi:hypothetical protein